MPIFVLFLFFPGMDIFYENLAHFTHGMAFAFFLAAAVFIKSFRNDGRLFRFLFLEMIFWAFIQLKDFGYLIPGYWDNEYISNIHLSIDHWCVPTTMLLFFEIVSPGWVTWKKALAVSVPSVFLTVLYIVLPSEGVFLAEFAWSGLLGLFAMVTVYMASARYDNFIKRNFSYLDNINLKWMRWVISLLFLLLAVWSFKSNYPTWFNDALYYIIAVIIWGLIFYHTMKHEVTADVPDYINPLSHPDEDNNGSTAMPDDKLRLESKLTEVMTGDKAYLDPKLSLAVLARMIGTNRTYLSGYINNYLELTFYEYVNSFRVSDAKSMLCEDKDERLTMEQIAERCGFYSLSTFKRSFLKETGATPGKYRKNARLSD